MRSIALFCAVIALSFTVLSQPRENEKLIEKGVKRYYKFTLASNNKIYYLSNTKYNPYSQIFTASISGVDSSENILNYTPGFKEMELVIDSFEVTSIFIAVELKSIDKVIIGE